MFSSGLCVNETPKPQGCQKTSELPAEGVGSSEREADGGGGFLCDGGGAFSVGRDCVYCLSPLGGGFRPICRESVGGKGGGWGDVERGLEER